MILGIELYLNTEAETEFKLPTMQDPCSDLTNWAI